MRRVLSLALALALPASSTQTTSGVSKSVEVSVTNLDVVVTDSNGKPIPDLTAAEFEVRQDGVVQPLTNFSFIRNGPAAAPAQAAEAGPRAAPAPALPAYEPPQAARAHLIVFVDELHLTSVNKNRALKSLRKYLPTVVGPNVEVQFVTWDRALRIRGPFTSDMAILSSLMDSLEHETTIGEVTKREHDQLVREIDSAVMAGATAGPVLLGNAILNLRSWCDQQAALVDTTLEALHASFAAVSGVEGRKVLFLLTEKFTPSPGRDIWDYLLYGTTRAGSVTSIASSRRGGGNADVNDLTWTTWDRGRAFRALTPRANAAGISIVTVDSAGLTTDEMVSAENSAAIGRMDEGIGQIDMQMAMGLLADETGGKTIVGRNDLALALKNLEADWTAYYSLGYESPSAKPGVPRAIKVSVKRPGANVRSRRAVIERTPEEKVSDAVLTGVHIPRTTNPLRASLTIGTPRPSGKMWLVPLEFKIPFDKLTLVPQGGRAKGAVLFTAVSATPDGRISPVTTERAPIDVPEKELAGLAGKAFTYSATLKVRPGPQIFSTGLTDEVSRLTSYVQPHVLVGDKPGKR
ncbi:MAG: VWA domain-containing protein [Acidobacteriota bacterium]